MLKMLEFVIQGKFLVNNKYKLFNMYIAYYLNYAKVEIILYLKVYFNFFRYTSNCDICIIAKRSYSISATRRAFQFVLMFRIYSSKVFYIYI